MPLAIADFSVGHSAVGSVADTISAFAPLVIAAWMAGICEDGVAAVPLVSVPVSPSVAERGDRAAGVRAVGGGEVGLPRFFGMTKTLRPVFSAARRGRPRPTRTPRTSWTLRMTARREQGRAQLSEHDGLPTGARLTVRLIR